jgi:hypothetical protein
VPSETIQDAVDRALDAYASLAELGEEIEDEWSYVNDLAVAWRERLEALTVERGETAAGAEVSQAIDVAIDEIARIVDPHRAIDWLSTFPQVVLVGLGERP